MIKSILKSDCIIFKENIEMSYNIIIKKNAFRLQYKRGEMICIRIIKKYNSVYYTKIL